MDYRGPILIADDDADFVVLLQVALEKAHIDNPAKIVRTGLEAIDYLEGKGAYADRAANPIPCMVLLDLSLPLRHGFEVLKWIRSHPEVSELVVVMLSGCGLERDKDMAEELGANSFLIKPIRFRALVELLEDVRDKWLPSMVPAIVASEAPSAAVFAEAATQG